VLATSRKTIPNAIASLRTTKLVKRKLAASSRLRVMNAATDGISIRIRRSGINLKNTKTFESYNAMRQRLRKTILTNRAISRNFGGVVIDATWYRGDGQGFRHQIRSGGGFNLANRQERERAIQKAVVNGTAKVGFSPIDVEIHEFWYEYFKDESVELRLTRGGDVAGVRVNV